MTRHDGMTAKGLAALAAIAAAHEDKEYVHMHCRAGNHRVCNYIYGGKACQCACHRSPEKKEMR